MYGLEEDSTTEETTGLIVGGVVVVGVLAWLFWPKSAAAGVTPVGNTAPTGPAAVTNPAFVQTVQTLVNGFVTNNNANASSNPAAVGTQMLPAVVSDGNPNQPAFVTSLAAAQKAINSDLTVPAAVAKYQQLTGQAWIPLRTDGVLDGYTYTAITNLAAVEGGTTPTPTPAAVLDMLQTGTTSTSPQALSALPGQSETIALPTGGTWSLLTLPGSTTPISVSGNQAYTFTYAGGGGSGMAVWTDSTGTSQTTYLTFAN